MRTKKLGATLLALVSVLGGNHSQISHRLQRFLRRRDKRRIPKNENSPSRTNPRGAAFCLGGNLLKKLDCNLLQKCSTIFILAAETQRIITSRLCGFASCRKTVKTVVTSRASVRTHSPLSLVWDHSPSPFDRASRGCPAERRHRARGPALQCRICCCKSHACADGNHLFMMSGSAAKMAAANA